VPCLVTSDLVADLYLIYGYSVRDIGAHFELAEVDVRRLLRAAGITVAHDEKREAVATRVAWLGYRSFDRFVSIHGTKALVEQADILGVPRGSLARLCAVYWSLVARRRRPTSDPNPDHVPEAAD